MHGLTYPIKFATATAAVILLGGLLPNGALSQTNEVRQPLYLPDPTPRPPDLEKIYAQNPEQKAREQQIAQMRNAQRHALIATDTDKITSLAGQLRDDLAQGTADINIAYNAQKAAEIQKLAKAIKNLEKQR